MVEVADGLGYALPLCLGRIGAGQQHSSGGADVWGTCLGLSGTCFHSGKIHAMPTLHGADSREFHVPPAQAGGKMLWQHPSEGFLGRAHQKPNLMSVLQRTHRTDPYTYTILILHHAASPLEFRIF